MRIDAHQHYWKIDRGDYGWITPDYPVLHRDYLPADFVPHLQRHELDGSILVQAAPTLAETEFLLTLSEEQPSIKGVVGWLDLLDPQHGEHHKRFQAYSKYVGFRIMIQDMPDPSIILEEAFVSALQGYAELGVPIDLLVTSGQLGVLRKLLELVPTVRGVIDHIGKPDIATGEFASWANDMKALAAYPSLYCKVSGMVTEAKHDGWEYEQFQPYIGFILESFGPERVMFGSDWPVCLLAAAYDEVVAVLEQALPASWGQEQRERLYGLNAKEFYRL